MNGSLPINDNAAFTPAIRPWAAASSYPVVPLIWPAKYKFLIFLVSSVKKSYLGSI